MSLSQPTALPIDTSRSNRRLQQRYWITTHTQCDGKVTILDFHTDPAPNTDCAAFNTANAQNTVTSIPSQPTTTQPTISNNPAPLPLPSSSSSSSNNVILTKPADTLKTTSTAAQLPNPINQTPPKTTTAQQAAPTSSNPIITSSELSASITNALSNQSNSVGITSNLDSSVNNNTSGGNALSNSSAGSLESQSADSSSPENNKTKIFIFVGILVAVSLIAFICIFCIRRKNKRKKEPVMLQDGKNISLGHISYIDDPTDINPAQYNDNAGLIYNPAAGQSFSSSEQYNRGAIAPVKTRSHLRRNSTSSFGGTEHTVLSTRSPHQAISGYSDDIRGSPRNPVDHGFLPGPPPPGQNNNYSNSNNMQPVIPMSDPRLQSNRYSNGSRDFEERTIYDQEPVDMRGHNANNGFHGTAHQRRDSVLSYASKYSKVTSAQGQPESLYFGDRNTIIQPNHRKMPRHSEASWGLPVDIDSMSRAG